LVLLPDRASIKSKYEERLQQLDNSHSHSWFGDHSSTYFRGFQPPLPGQSFDVEWGFIPGFHGSRNPGWQICSRDEILFFLFHDIGESIFHEMRSSAEELTTKFCEVGDQALDVMELLSKQGNLQTLARYSQRMESEFKPYKIVDFINSRLKSTPRMTRDSEEIAKVRIVPIQVQHLAAFQSLASNRSRLREMASTLRNVIESISLQEAEQLDPNKSTSVFIGHGRSAQWRILKDFIGERLDLQYEEFNRISVAGINTQERLTEMLDRCGFAFLVLAGEDLHGDGSLHARENVIHEAGLFQGRLGWRKAIVLLAGY